MRMMLFCIKFSLLNVFKIKIERLGDRVKRDLNVFTKKLGELEKQVFEGLRSGCTYRAGKPLRLRRKGKQGRGSAPALPKRRRWLRTHMRPKTGCRQSSSRRWTVEDRCPVA